MNPTVAVKPRKNKVSPNETNGKKEIYYPEEEPKEKTKLGETDYQHNQISKLETMLRLFLKDRQDVYLASDLLFFYEEGKPRLRLAPDIMICFGVENKMRRSYKLWEEKVSPSFVIEIASKETWDKDLTTKRRIYEKIGVGEYYIFDPEYSYLPVPLLAYHLENGEFIAQKVVKNRVTSKVLGLELVDNGKDLRLFNPKTNEFLPTIQELAELESSKNAKIAELEAEIARLRGLQK